MKKSEENGNKEDREKKDQEMCTYERGSPSSFFCFLESEKMS